MQGSHNDAIAIMSKLPGYDDQPDIEISSVIENKNTIDDGDLERNKDCSIGVQHEEDVATDVENKEKVRLEWRQLTVNAILPQTGYCTCFKKRKKPKLTPVLKEVNGVAESGSLLAIMGASGAGKTTMLNVLSRQDRSGLEIKGSVLVNNKNIKDKIKAISAYVRQEDLFVGTLTVKEHLIFQAMLRMDVKYTKEEKLQRVNEVMSQLGLFKCQDTVIGVPGRLRGISGGEKKRLSFASEIITNPKLLFVDEPTSGLDSFMAENCVLALQKLANEGRTVLATIHQPSSGVFQMFDRLLLMSEGRTAFLGSREEAADFFNECGYPNPPNFNPADHFIQVLAATPGSELDCRKRSADICDAFAASKYSTGKDYCETEKGQLEVITKPSYQVPFLSQIRMITWRSMKQVQREPMLGRVRLIQTLVISAIVGLIFLQQPHDQDGVTNLNGVMFFMIISLSFSNASAIVTIFPSEIPIFLKENKLAMYRAASYFIGRQTAEIPFYILVVSLQTTVIYWMAGLNSQFLVFLKYFGICHLTAQAAISYGMIIAAVAPTTNFATAITAPMMLPMILFGGFFVKDKSIPIYFVWLKVFSWPKYGFELAVINQWEDFGTIGCSNNTVCLRDGKQVITRLGYNTDDFYISLGCLLALVIGFRLIAYAFILLRVYRSK